ncbi:MAG: hypothetical protein VX709_06635 [Pseudomonadota bacterium]|nr:hypothetical protein [Pseudomonadota bacterium]
MTGFLTGYSEIVDLASLYFVVGSLAGFALTASFSRASRTIVVDLAYPVGLLGSLIGWVGILQNMSDPKAIGPAMAISFLTVLYAAVIHGLASGRSRDLSEIDSTFAKKLVGSLAFVVLVLWAVDIVAGIGAFMDPSAVVLFVLSILFCIIFDRVSGDTSKNGWGVRFLGVGLLGFFIGTIGMLANIDDPKAIGPSVAVAFLSLTYALFLLCIGRIWFPGQTLDSEQNINTGFLALAFPVLIGAMITFAIPIMWYA